MQSYRRMTLYDRIQITHGIKTGLKIRQIAQGLGFHPSSIHREIQRNRDGQTYRARDAQTRCQERFKNCRRHYLINGDFQKRIERKLQEYWSPEQICGRLWKEEKISLSPQTIYRFIQRDPQRRKFFKYYLRRPPREGIGRYLRRKRKNEKLLRIFLRPEIANQRKRIGDWERDTMYCKDRKMILVCTDRKSRFTCFNKLPNFKSRTVFKKTMKLLKPLQTSIHTITNDNAPEFRDADLFADIPVYYCDPKRPQQRGTVENTIGLLRQYIKRTSDLKNFTEERLKSIEFELNMRPRKCLDYKTPYEVFFHQSVALAL